jgi:hypothetical protein
MAWGEPQSRSPDAGCCHHPSNPSSSSIKVAEGLPPRAGYRSARRPWCTAEDVGAVEGREMMMRQASSCELPELGEAVPKSGRRYGLRGLLRRLMLQRHKVARSRRSPRAPGLGSLGHTL